MIMQKQIIHCIDGSSNEHFAEKSYHMFPLFAQSIHYTWIETGLWSWNQLYNPQYEISDSYDTQYSDADKT